MKKALLFFPVLLLLTRFTIAQSLIPFHCTNGKWGYVNKNNYLVVNCQFSYAGLMKDGYAHVANEGKWGVIDSTGKIVIPLQYGDIWSVYKGTVIYEETSSGRRGITSVSGKVSLPLGKLSYIGSFTDGFSVIEQSGKRGMINYLGDLVVPLKYKSILPFSEGLAMVKSDDGLYGYVDKKGKVIVPVKYESAEKFIEGFAAVRLDGKYGFVNTKGKVAIPLTWDYAGSFAEGMAVVKKDNLYGFINTTGELIVPCKYAGLGKYYQGYKDGMAIIEKDGKYGCIDKTGKEIIPPYYDTFETYSDSLALVSKDGNNFFVDVEGKVRITPLYDEVNSFFYGKAIVKKNNRFGLIAKDGSEILPCEYYKMEKAADGFIRVEMVSPYRYEGYIDKTGKPYYYTTEELKKQEEDRLEFVKKITVDIDQSDMAKYVCFGYDNFVLGYKGEKDLYRQVKSPVDTFRIKRLDNNRVQLQIHVKMYKNGSGWEQGHEFLLKCPLNLTYGLVNDSGFKTSVMGLRSILLNCAVPEGADEIFKTIKGVYLPWENRLYLGGYVRDENNRARYFEIAGVIDPTKPYNTAEKSILQMIFDLQK